MRTAPVSCAMILNGRVGPADRTRPLPPGILQAILVCASSAILSCWYAIRTQPNLKPDWLAIVTWAINVVGLAVNGWCQQCDLWHGLLISHYVHTEARTVAIATRQPLYRRPAASGQAPHGLPICAGPPNILPLGTRDSQPPVRWLRSMALCDNARAAALEPCMASQSRMAIP